MILNLKIQNYKSIENANMDFGTLNVLIGKNGAGKTTLISVISMIKDVVSGKNINAIANEIAPYGEFFNANTNDHTAHFEVEIQTKVNNCYRYAFSICFGMNPHKISRDEEYYFSDESLHKIDSQSRKDIERIFYRNINDVGFISGETDERKIPQRVSDGVAVLSAFAQQQAQEVASLLSEYSIIWMSQGSSVSGNLQFANDLDLTTIDGVAVGLYLKSKEDFDEAMGILGEIIHGFVVPSISRLPLGPDDDEVGNSRSGFLVRWNDGVYVKNKSFSSGVLSGGNNRVIYLILSLYYSGAKTCFVAEEIENGMHLGRLSDLMDKLKMIGKNRKIQLFLTTHNYLILDDLLPKEVILAKLGDHGSEYVRLSETSEYADIRDDLGRDPTSREMADSGLLFA